MLGILSGIIWVVCRNLGVMGLAVLVHLVVQLVGLVGPGPVPVPQPLSTIVFLWCWVHWVDKQMVGL